MPLKVILPHPSTFVVDNMFISLLRFHVLETQDMTIPPASFEVYFNRWVQLWSFVVWNTTVPYHIVEYEELQTNLEETLMGMQ